MTAFACARHREAHVVGRLALLSTLVAIGSIAGYVLLLRVAVARNHPEAYVIGCAIATALAVWAVARARARRWPAWLALDPRSMHVTTMPTATMIHP